MNKGKILFIDDDSFLRKVYQAELHDKGFDVELAVDGEDGLLKIGQLRPDCVILDLIMPKKSGFEVLSDLQRIDDLRSIPVIILSNLAQSDDQKRALDLGAVEYLIKDNTTLDIIAERIEYHIQMSKKRGPLPSRSSTVDQRALAHTQSPTPQSKGLTDAFQKKKPATRSAHNFCPECGTKLEKGAKFCSQCGTQQY